MEDSIREARLRPEYAGLYPGITPGAWMPATDIGRQLLLWDLTASATPRGDRLLAEEHFEFRGGGKREGAWADGRNHPGEG